MTTTTISVPAWELRRALGAVLPHVSRTDSLPQFRGVHMQVRYGVLYLAAMDRYTLAATRITIPGAGTVPLPDAPALLPRPAAKGLRRFLRGADGLARLTAEGTRLSVSAADGSGATWDIGAQDGSFPDWRALLHGMLTAGQAPLGDRYGADPAMLGRFAGRKDAADGESLNIRVTLGAHRTGAASPVVLLTRGGWFTGALMPVMRNDDGEAETAGAWADWTAITAPAALPEPELAAVAGA